jgi:RimJ/RimL family protein N-acetyltransferase
VLRAIDERDLPQLLEWRNALRKYFREYRVLTYVDQARWYEAIQGDPTQTMFSIVDQGELLGACGLVNIDWKNGSAEVSIYLGEGYIDGTIAPAALKELMTYAFDELGLHRLWAEVFDYDSDKAVLFQNASFNCEGVLKQTYFKLGKYHDSEIYGFLEPAWRSA